MFAFYVFNVSIKMFLKTLSTWQVQQQFVGLALDLRRLEAFRNFPHCTGKLLYMYLHLDHKDAELIGSI